ncbi:MAG: hypothetical protein K2X47_07010 [Bdellovibrionales bacterium]|nr:hypothetical protein [Bdellovibrionales bacterium]
MSELKKSEKTASKASSAETLYWISMIAAGFGGFFLGSALASRNMSTTEKNNSLLASVGLIGASIGGMYYVDENLNEAIESYQSDLGKKKSEALQPKARVSILRDGLGMSVGWSY